MKHTLKISIVPFLFALICSLSLSAASTPGHHNPTVDKGKKAVTTNQPNNKHTTAKETKKFTTVSFVYANTTGLGITDPNNWTSGTGTCPSGTTNLCYITFDDTQTGYGLVNNKPSQTFLQNQVAVHQNDFASSSFTVNGVTYFKKL